MSDVSRLRAFVGANILDVVSTTLGVHVVGGTLPEANPVAGALLSVGNNYALSNGLVSPGVYEAVTVAPWVAAKVAVVAAVCVALWFSRETPGWRPFVALLIYATVAVSVANVGAVA
jgi:hypothetical protein